MAKKKNRELSNYERRRLRIQQVIFIAIGVLVILSMVISLFINL
jgi:predicted nucleic acid-binding Zn ribbon protein